MARTQTSLGDFSPTLPTLPDLPRSRQVRPDANPMRAAFWAFVFLCPALAFAAEPWERRPVTAADVARFPAPGTVAPGSFAFTIGGKALTYLKAESPGGGLVLWRWELSGNTRRVIAQPPGRGDTDANVSQAEALRRERMRLRDSGITQIVRASKADVAVIPLHGDLYLLRGDAALERLTQTPAPEIDPQLTPDGTKVGFVRDDELYLIDLATKKETRLTSGAKPGVTHALAEFIAQEEMDRFSGFWWASDGSRIAFQETDERHVPLYSIAHEGSEIWSLETHHYPFAGAANARVRLGTLTLGKSEAAWLNLAGSAEDDYLARVVWESATSLLVQRLSRDQKSLRLYRVEVESGRSSLLLEERSATWVNLHDDLKVLRDGFLWSSERTGFRHLERRGKDGALARVLTSGDWPVDSVLLVDEPRGEVWFASGREDPCAMHVDRVALDGGPIARVTSAPGMHRAVVSRDGRYFVDVHSRLDAPPKTTLRGRDGKLLATIADGVEDPRVAELRLAPPVLTEYKNRDGVTLRGAYYAPRSRALGGKAPLVVMVYGGPHLQTVTNSWAMTADLTAQLLAGRGFAVWKTDNRGSARRGHEFEAALNRNMGDVEVRDQVDGVKFVGASWNEVDTTRVGVTGGSYGGYMTLRCLTMAPEVFKAGVAVAPVTDWDGYDTCYTERYMGTPENNPEGYRAASVLTHAGDLSGALLLVHGMLDENVHFRHSARLANALIAAGRPFELLPIPDARHGARKEDDRTYITERMAAFFEQRLGPRAP